MGAYSTIKITETRARKEVLAHLMTCSNEELASFMDVILENRLYNCRIVPDDCEENDNSILY